MTQITGETAILWMFTDPVRHVRATVFINDHLAALGVNAVMSPLRVKPADLAYMLDAARRTENVAGLGLTKPHKVTGHALMDHLTPAAKAQGAVNFVRRNADGTLTGHNIDGEGFLAGLAEHGVDPAGRHAMVLGAGGVGRPIAIALAGAGVGALTLANRTRGTAEDLAADLAGRFPAVTVRVADYGDAAALAGVDLLVNGTSVGMNDDTAQPVELTHLAPTAAVADVVFTPRMTMLLKAAEAKGCRIVTGDAMLKPQPRLLSEFLGLLPG